MHSNNKKKKKKKKKKIETLKHRLHTSYASTVNTLDGEFTNAATISNTSTE